MGAIDFATKYKNARERIFDLLGDLRFHSWKECPDADQHRKSR